jgi:hypothetical protein
MTRRPRAIIDIVLDHDRQLEAIRVAELRHMDEHGSRHAMQVVVRSRLARSEMLLAGYSPCSWPNLASIEGGGDEDPRDGESNTVTGLNRCSAEDFSPVPDPDSCGAASSPRGIKRLRRRVGSAPSAGRPMRVRRACQLPTFTSSLAGRLRVSPDTPHLPSRRRLSQ